MKIHYYAMTFAVTETLQNGSERRKKVTVNCLPFKHNENNRLIHRTQEERIAACTAALKEEHYYDIQYVGVKNTNIIYA